MQPDLTLHIIASSSKLRAKLARVTYGLGYHCELYTDFEEFAACLPASGFVLAQDRGASGDVERVVKLLAKNGLWLPVFAMMENPDANRAVELIKNGVYDLLKLPLEVDDFKRKFATVDEDVRRVALARNRQADACRRLRSLSNRELEVLQFVCEGMSNKEIGRHLEISPRTVEIHRSNMLEKLGAANSAAAVRTNMEAMIDTSRFDLTRVAGLRPNAPAAEDRITIGQQA